MSDTSWPRIESQIAAQVGSDFRRPTRQPAGGGCICEAWILDDGRQRFFVKLHEASRADMFAAEAEGLAEIAQCSAIRCPRPICFGHDADRAWLVLEYLPLRPVAGRGWRSLGEQLAAMHGCTKGEYGWSRDNTIGSTPQVNAPEQDWDRFWRDRRLAYQLRLAINRGYAAELEEPGERLLEYVPVLLDEHRPAASLLHGDLWRGNTAADGGGQPVIFDPAVYYGDRETDLAMTELFGGFGREFYAAYRAILPPDEGYRIRRELYNLYHLLNHLNLFGAGYLRQVRSTMGLLLSEVVA